MVYLTDEAARAAYDAAPRNTWLVSGQPTGEALGRRRPTWSPKTRRHAWDRIADGHSYQCGHCRIGKRSVQDRPGDDRSWFTVWVDPIAGTSGSTRRGGKLPDCPGPNRPGAVEGAAP